MVAICSPWMCRWWMCSRCTGGSCDGQDFMVCAKELVPIRNDRGPCSAGQDHSRLGLASLASGVAGSSLRASARHNINKVGYNLGYFQLLAQSNNYIYNKKLIYLI